MRPSRGASVCSRSLSAVTPGASSTTLKASPVGSSTASSGLFGLVLGLLSALGRMSKSRILNVIAGAYIEFFRGTPLLVQLFIIYFGLPSLPFIQPMPAFWAGVVGLTVYVGAYYAEIIRGAFNAIPLGQTEAAQVLGLSNR